VTRPSYEETLWSLCQRDERIVVLTAENRAAIRGLPDKLGARFIDVGIAEQTMIGVAAGLALCGRIPVVHALATFLTLRAFEFIRSDLGIGRLPAILVGGVPGFLSTANGPTHQAIDDVALMRGIPGMQVVCPADAHELVDALPAIVASEKLTYLRYCDVAPHVAHAPYALGKAEIIVDGRTLDAGAARDSDDVAIVVTGFMLGEALVAQRILGERGYRVSIVNTRSVVPLDEDAVVDAAGRARLVVTLEDHLLTGGLYAAVCELFVRRGVHAPVLPIGLDGKWFVAALLPDVLEVEGFTGAKLAQRISAALDRAPARLRVAT
jgi:transketolase